MADYLGADQQAPSPPFLRTFYKTDFQKVRERMISILKQRAAWDLFNPALWGQIGIDGGPVDDFMENYIGIAKRLGEPLTADNADRYALAIHEQYGTPLKRLDVYIDVFLTMIKNNEVPNPILAPWTYTPDTSIGEDIAKVARRGGTTLLILGVIGVGVYAFASRGVPRLIRE
jgi:hypothetical protein